MVAGSRIRKISIASRPGSTPVETPKSPWAMRWTNRQYWVHSGWSRPNAASSSARRSGVARSPRIADTGPPGSDLSHMKSRNERTTMTSTSWISRRTMNRTMHSS